MVRTKWNLWGLLGILVISGLFYYQTILFGKLPVPSDTLIGLYHPWRDAYSSTYPNGIPYKNFLITDPIRQQIPWRNMVMNQWKTDHRVGWDPTSFGGTSLVYNLQSGAWYPLNVLFLIFPFTGGWTILIILQTVLFLLFTYFFLIRKKLHPLAALFGAVTTTFSGFSIAWLTWGTIVSAFMWLPLMLVSIDGIIVCMSKRKYLQWLGLLTISYFCSLTAGHIQTTFYVFLIAGIYALWSAFLNHSWKPLLLSLSAGLITLFLIFPVLPGFLNSLLNTIRSSGGAAWQVEGFFIPIRHLIQFIIPDFFGNPATLNYWGTWNYGEMVGYVGIGGIIFALLSLKQRNRETWFFSGIVLIGLLFATENPLSRLIYLWKVPIFSLLQPTRLLSVVCFGLAILAAYGFDAFIRNRVLKKHLIMTFVIVAVVFVASLITIKTTLLSVSEQMIAFRNTLFPLMIFFCSTSLIIIPQLVRRKIVARKVLIVILFTLSIYDLFRFGWKFTPFTTFEYFFPNTRLTSFLKNDFATNPTRILSLDSRILPSNTFSWYSIEAVGGYNPFYSQRYARYVETMESGTVSARLPSFQRIIEPTNIHSPLFKYFNVRYVVGFYPPQNTLSSIVLQEGQTVVSELSTYLPRWYLADTVIVESNSMMILDYMNHDGVASRSAFVETTEPIISRANTMDSLSSTLYTANTQVISTNTSDLRYLVNLTAWDIDWHAYIDDREVPIFKTNYLFMGIVVPSGTHAISFRYN